MVHQIFISYPSENKAIADTICAYLEKQQYRCWIAPRDILPGQNFAEALYDAIDSSRIFVLVFSEITNKSPHIMSEIQRAFNNNIVIIPFRVEPVEPSKALQYYIGTAHWLDALTPPLEEQVEKLRKVVAIFLEKSNEDWEDINKTEKDAAGANASAGEQVQGELQKPVPAAETGRTPASPVLETRPEADTARFCPICNIPLKSGARFCVKCGFNVEHGDLAIAGPASSRQASSPSLCPSCSKPLKPGVVFCGRCGMRIEPGGTGTKPAGLVCPHCKKPVRPGSRFCSRCGKGL